LLERPFYYASPDIQTLAASETSYDRRIEIHGNSDFYLRGMCMLNASGAVAGRFRRPDGSFFTGDPEFMHLTGFMNTAGFARWTPIYPQIMYPRNGAFVYDLRDLGGAGDAGIFPFLVGVERYDEGEVQQTPIPKAYVEHDHSIQVTKRLRPRTKLSISRLRAVASAVRSVSWSFVGSEPLTLHFRLWDQYQKMFMNTWAPLRCLFAGPTSATRPYPASIFPQIIIPAYGRLSLDLWNRTEAGPFTIELTFSGVRMVGV
jgi:hypothetical protein